MNKKLLNKKFLNIILAFLVMAVVFIYIQNKKNSLNSEDIVINLNAKIDEVVKNTPELSNPTFSAKTTVSTEEIDDVIINKKETLFENGDKFNIVRLNYTKNDTENFYVSIPIIGNTIDIKYVDPISKEWVVTNDIKNLGKNILFIDTDTNSYLFSVPAVYSNDFTNNTLTILKNKEKPVKIIKEDTGEYKLIMRFPKNTNCIGEYWFMESNERLVNWNNYATSFQTLKVHDLGVNSRWSYYGYYFPVPHNYVPYGKNVIYRHPSNYVGSYFVRYGKNLLEKNMGYIMTETCMQNQNSEGFWETGAKSLWLEKDYKIKENFYDTRFNSDFGLNLLYAYEKYNNK